MVGSSPGLGYNVLREKNVLAKTAILSFGTSAAFLHCTLTQWSSILFFERLWKNFPYTPETLLNSTSQVSHHSQVHYEAQHLLFYHATSIISFYASFSCFFALKFCQLSQSCWSQLGNLLICRVSRVWLLSYPYCQDRFKILRLSLTDNLMFAIEQM